MSSLGLKNEKLRPREKLERHREGSRFWKQARPTFRRAQESSGLVQRLGNGAQVEQVWWIPVFAAECFLQASMLKLMAAAEDWV